MLQITFSNRLETLRDALLDALDTVPASAFTAEQVIVPSSALRRDLNLAMAERFGVCAQVEFSYLAQWLWQQIARVVPTVAAESPFAASVLSWRIYQLFGDPALVSAHPRLAAYLGAADEVVRFDLAVKVAGVFEQYITYRSVWLAEWMAGRLVTLPHESASSREDQLWQAALWRAVMGQLGVEREHPASAFLRSVESLGNAAAQRFGLPEVAHVFCLPTSPPLYLDLLRQLGHWIDIRLYVLNPCREYWFEIVDRRRLSYLAARGEADYHETGNRLLASWGKQTQSSIELLLEASMEARVDDGGFLETGSDTLLGQVQDAILNLSELEPGSIDHDPADRSIEIHLCHSLTRELEVLQDQLLALFAGPHPPRPSDILVVVPDLEAAAPLVEAVFGNVPRERSIPYSVSGRARSTVNEPARALLALLALVGSRFSASAVFELLQQPIVARRFGISGDDLGMIQGWMQASGIRWGIDGRHREQHDLPGLERFSFSDGLQRLFLGYALPGRIHSPWLDLLPAGNAEGSDALALGQFAHFVAELTRLREICSQARTPEAWMRHLSTALDTFLAPADEDIDDLSEIRAELRKLHTQMKLGGVTSPVSLDVVRRALEGLLDDPARGGVPTGMVTFTSMSSLRNLPFRIICALGLNDGAFPSASRPLEFDLMTLAPQPGDRQRRIDERNLFLDLVLAARERLYLSYTGRSVRDNAPLPSSVLVAELIETLVPALAADPTSAASREAARRSLVVEHQLQPFSHQYFSEDADPRARSFNRELCAALRAGVTANAVETELADLNETEEEDEDDDAHETVARFFQAPLAPPEPEWREVDLGRLLYFFRNPCRFLLRERLGITLVEAGDELVDEEPFLPDFLGRQALAERLLPLYHGGLADEDLLQLAQAGIEYPPGSFGDLLLDQELHSLRRFADTVQAATEHPVLEPHHGSLTFTLADETWHLNGAFADLRATGLVRHRYDDTRAVDYLEGWLQHLFLCATLPAEADVITHWISRNGEYRIHRCQEATAILHDLLDLYRRGLQEPLHFFPKSAWKYMEYNQNMSKARSTWQSSRNPAWSESAHPAYHLALRGIDDPLDEDFLACAETVFGSLLRYLEDPRL